MPIIDMNAWTGHWPTLPVDGQVAPVRWQLAEVGVTRICLAPLDAVWCHNPHQLNEVVYHAALEYDDITAVPVIDPTIATWEAEVERAYQAGAGLVKLVPAYSQYDLADASDLAAALVELELPVSVQVRLEDPRRNHPLAKVADTDAQAIATMAQQYPDLTVVIGGATTAVLLALQDQLRDTPRLYADISQADGMDAVRRLVDAGLGKKLVFGSHAPLFRPLAGLARVLPELDDQSAGDILYGNAAGILGD
jgi:predicted TIM-barrel fold metal-dependent hydrolase